MIGSPKHPVGMASAPPFGAAALSLALLLLLLVWQAPAQAENEGTDTAPHVENTVSEKPAKAESDEAARAFETINSKRTRKLLVRDIL